MTLDASGRLGVGTTSPSQPVEVQKNFDGATWLKITNTTNGSGARAGLLLANDVSDYGSIELNSSSVSGTANALSIRTSAAYPIVFQTNNTERARIDSSGNMGLGVTPSAYNGLTTGRLEFGSAGCSVFSNGSSNSFYSQNTNYDSGYKYAANGAAGLYLQSAGTHQWYTAASGTAGNAITFTQGMTLTAAGRLGVGQTAPGVAFSVAGASEVWQIAFAYANSGTGALIGSPASDVIAFGNWAGSERARIDSSGNFQVGFTGSQTSKVNFVQSANLPVLTINNTNASFTDGALIIYNTRATTNSSYNHFACYNGDFTGQFIVRDSGNAVNTNNSYGAVSDVKLKENIVDASPKLDKLNQVRVVNYNLIGSEQKQLGVIAQELEQVFPSMVEEAVDRDKEGNDLGTTTKSVKYSVFVPMLIKAIQEQQAIIESLKARLDAANL
jgi:hypothetical protein